MVHRAGVLDTRVALQRKTSVTSPSGEPMDTWGTIATRWAAYAPIERATEMNVAAQWVAREQIVFTIRWDQGIADFSPKDRIVCPAVDADATTEQSRSIYDVIAVHLPDRNDSMKILTARRSDAP